MYNYPINKKSYLCALLSACWSHKDNTYDFATTIFSVFEPSYVYPPPSFANFVSMFIFIILPPHSFMQLMSTYSAKLKHQCVNKGNCSLGKV